MGRRLQQRQAHLIKYRRTIQSAMKTRIWRYFAKRLTVRHIVALQDFVHSYNDTYHRSIGMALLQVNASKQEKGWQRVYGHYGRVCRRSASGITYELAKRGGGTGEGTWRIRAKSASQYATRFTPIQTCTSLSTICEIR